MDQAIYRVVFLQIAIQFDLEHVDRDMGKLLRGLSPRWAKKAMHAQRMIGLVIVTDESPAELRQSLLGTLTEDMNCVDDFWVYPAPKADDVVGQLGAVSPLSHWLRMAQVEAARRNRPEKVRYRQAR